jgi:hypothetical protein
MDLIIFLALFTFTKTTTLETEQTFKKIDKSGFDIKITEIGDNIVVSLSSNDYLPLLGSWLTGNKIISSNQFYNQGNGTYEWLSQNLTKKATLKYFLNALSNRVFEFETEKKIFEKNKDTFECKLELVKKKDLETIANDYFDKISMINPSNEKDIEYAFDETVNLIVNCGITYGIKFTNKDDNTPNFNEYEVVVYKSKKNIDLQPDKKTLKKKFVAIGKNALVGAAVFGPYAILLSYFVFKRL